MSSGDWWRGLNAYAADHGSGVEVVVVRDAHAVLESGLDVVCTDDTVVWFTRGMVSQAEAAGITVVGVRAAGDPHSDAQLVTLGIEHRLSDSVAPAAMLELLARLRPRDAFEQIVSQLDVPHAGRPGSLVMVGGPPGAGSREVAVGVAAQLADTAATVLVDCNELSPGVAQRLGLRLQPHLLDAAEAATSGADVRAALAQPADPSASTTGLRFDVVAGLPAASEWHRCSTAAVDVLLAACQSAWRYTVVTTSPIVEDLRRWVDRFGLSRHLLSMSEPVVGVCEATPRGVLRFVDWLAEAQPRSPVLTVVNKVPGSRFSAAEVVAELRSLCGERIEVVATVPLDRRVMAAEWDARLPAKGPFTRALRAVFDAVSTTPVPAAEVPA